VAKQFEGLFQGDLDGRQVSRKAARFLAALDEGTEPAVGGNNRLAGVGMRAQGARQAEQLQGVFQIDVLQVSALDQRSHSGFLAVAPVP
jgi:hypothetical protein